ncbi:MAG TPA: phage tail length tape measure family protein [Devosia sp.]|nr:phage tail length tape measure family protein [Devosia sp.]
MANPFVISMKFTGDGSGAVAAANAIRQEVGQLGNALDASSGKAAELQANVSRLAVQQERIAALSANGVNSALGVRDDFNAAARGADIEVYGRKLDELRARFNPLFAAEQRHQASLASIRQANRLGAISAQEMAAAVRAEEGAYAQSVAAISGNTQALERNRTVRASMAGSGGFATANVAAQFQDIAVTSAMGMSPLQIALQQGTQISAAFGNMGAAGAVRTLGAAFLSIISPVSLVTIGLVAGGAAAIQYFSGLGRGAETADQRLDHHLERIQALSAGYDDATKAATDYVESSRKVPEGSVTSNLEAARRAAIEQTSRDLDTLAQKQAEIATDFDQMSMSRTLHADVLDAAAGLDSLGISADSTQAQIDAVHTRLTELANDNSAPEQARRYARDLLTMVENLQASRTEVESLGIAIENMPHDILVKIRVQTERFGEAMDDLSSIVPDARPRTAIMRDENETAFQKAALNATTTSALNAATELYQDNLKGISALEKEQAERDAARAAKAAAQVSAYDRQIEAIQERTEAQKTETNVIGLGTFASEKARVTLELETAARKDAIGLTPERVAQIEEEASAYAKAAAAQETLLEKQQAATEQYEFARSTFRSFFTDLSSGLRDGQDGWEALGMAGANALDRIAERALSMAADGIFDMIFNAIGSAIGGGGQKGGSFLSFLGFADGGWTGGSAGQPRGIVHGEEFVVRAGPASQHRALLETINAGGSPSMGTGATVTLAPVYNFNGSSFTQAQAHRMMQENNRDLMAMLPGAMNDASRRAVRGAA